MMIADQLDHIDFLAEKIEKLDIEVERRLLPFPTSYIKTSKIHTWSLELTILRSRKKDVIIKNAVKKLEILGYEVKLSEKEEKKAA